MNQERLEAKEQLNLISDVISSTKARFERNGSVFLFWGVLLTLASAAQFILLLLEYYEINYYPYFGLILGWFYMFYYYSKEKKRTRRKNVVNKLIDAAWIYIGINSALLGFIYAPTLGSNLIPVLLIIQSVGVLLTGIVIKHQFIFYAGIFCNVAGFVALSLEYLYQPLLTSIVYFVVLVIPGYLLSKNYKKTHAA
ncbi:MAG: hypothetical protein AAF847_05215 [Bacteroidota bacterium]